MNILTYHLDRLLKEVLVVVVISTLPVWLGPLLLPVIDQTDPLYKDVSGYAGKVFAIYKDIASTGDLALYACSFMAAIAYLIGDNYDRNFPAKPLFILVIAIMTFGSAVIYVSNVTALKNDEVLTIYSSIIVFFVSLLVWIIAVVNKNWLIDPTGAMRQSETDFVSGYEDYMEGNK